MLEELCRDGFFKACKAVSGPVAKVRGRSSPYADFYESSTTRYNWKRVPLNAVTRGRTDGIRGVRIKAWHYMTDNADKLREHYLRVRWDRDLARAMTESGKFENLFEDFYAYFEKRREMFMKNTNKLLDANIAALAAKGKRPQSHGGVANLLKVLTKTMHDQGSSVYTIAKVQYAVCVQAGIYIPDDFLTDVLVAHEMIQEG